MFEDFIRQLMFRMLLASVGDVCLDVKDLVVKTVGGEQRPEKVG